MPGLPLQEELAGVQVAVERGYPNSSYDGPVSNHVQNGGEQLESCNVNPTVLPTADVPLRRKIRQE